MSPASRRSQYEGVSLMNTKQGILIIMGLGADQKPRAATFVMEDVETAAKAANHMGLKLAKADSAEALAMAKELPQGKLFASGKGLLPLVRREVYDKLLKLFTPVDAKAAVPAAKPAEPAAAAAVTAEPGFKSAWHAIEVGATVLWRAGAMTRSFASSQTQKKSLKTS